MLELTRLKVFREVAETARLGGRVLRVTAFPTAAATLIPAAAATFREGSPTVDLRLTEADPPESVPALLAGDHDLAVVYDYPALGGGQESGVDLEPLFVDHMAVAVPAGHRLAGAAVLALSDLAIERVTFIATRSGAYRSPLAGAFRAALRQAVTAVSDPVLPLEAFEPQEAVAAP